MVVFTRCGDHVEIVVTRALGDFFYAGVYYILESTTVTLYNLKKQPSIFGFIPSFYTSGWFRLVDHFPFFTKAKQTALPGFLLPDKVS